MERSVPVKCVCKVELWNTAKVVHGELMFVRIWK